MARGNAYCHAMLRMQNIPTEPASDLTDIFNKIDEL
jgi:hypothetical protein